MKYPITPEFMYSLPLPLIALYQRLEEQILEDICSRVAMTGEMTETAIEHIRSLQRRGYDYKKINEYIRKTLKLTQSEFDTVWNKAVQRNQQYFDTLIDDNLILGENNFNADLFMQEINAIEMQTLGALTNITQSMGFAYRAPDGTVKVDDIGRMYQRVLDDALMRVESGQSYNMAIRDATKMLTDSGLQYVDYESGWHNRVDVAARRAVMTGVTQLSRQYTEQTATLLDTPYRGYGAPRCARWRGKNAVGEPQEMARACLFHQYRRYIPVYIREMRSRRGRRLMRRELPPYVLCLCRGCFQADIYR